MENSDFLENFLNIVNNKYLIEKLLKRHNCGLLQIDTSKSLVSIFFYNKHHYFKTDSINYELQEFYKIMDKESAIQFQSTIEEFKNNRKIANDEINIKLINSEYTFQNFSVYLYEVNDVFLRGMFVESVNINPFSTEYTEYYKLLENALSLTNIFIWKWDFKSKKQIFSNNWYEFLGYHPNEIEFDFDTQRKMLHPDDWKKVENEFNDFFSRNKEFYEIEFRIKRKDNTWQWFLSKGRITKVDKQNNPIELIGLHIDINDLKRLQNENESTYLNLINLINLADDIICIKDPEGRWLMANEADLKLFQLQDVDYFGKTDYDLSYFTNNIYKDAFKTCMITDEIAWKKGDISRSDEIIPLDEKGNEKIYDVIKKPIFNPDGTRKALIVMGRDVTQKRSVEQIERRLATQNRIIREFAVLLLNQKTIDNVLDILTRYLSEINSNITVITTKLSNNNILKISSVYPSNFLRTVIKHFPNAFENLAIKLSDDYVNNTIDKFRHFGVVHNNLYDASLQKLPKYIAKSIQEIFGIKSIETIGIIFENECYGFISFLIQENDRIEDKDIVESMVYLAAQAINRLKTLKLLENAKKAYESSNLSKDKFFSVLAHDLEQPIRNLLQYSETLSDNFNTIPVSELRKLLNELKDNISYTNYLLENLFEWSKIEMNKIEFKPQSVSIYKFYLENERMIITGTTQKNQNFINLLNQDHFVEVDIYLISMVFRNLINNAIKFTPQKGKIEIESFDIGNFIRVDIRDNGVGIDKEGLSKLFRKDMKYSTLGTEGEEGTGLGLIVAQSYIQMHGGELHIDSEKDKGTIVFFTLPKQL